MKNYCDGGEAILEALRHLGVDYIISSPGSEWGSVWEAMARQKVNQKSGPTYIDCWHENTAVNMALGYTRVTGKPQCVLLHAGAGLLQGSMAIHTATQAEVPVVIMSGESLSYGENPDFDPGSQWYRSLSIVGGPQRLLEPIVKWSSQATSSYTLYESVTRAFELAQRGPMGPIYLNVPIETMLAEWTPPEKRRDPPPAPKTQPLPQDVEKVAALLAAARNPVISTDSVGRDPDAIAALVDLAELLAVPVFESRATQYANFPRSHGLHLGFNIEPHLNQTDLALLVKSRVPWYPPSRYPTGGPIVAIDENPLKAHMVYQNLQADHYLEGDVATALKLLAASVRSKEIASDRIAERRQRWQSEHEKHVARLREVEAKAREAAPIDPLWLLGALNEVMPEDTVYLDETIVHSPVLQQHLNWDKPQSYFYVPGGLGQGLATALGVKLALPKRPVVLCVGDGSLLYNPITQALGASRDNNLPIIVLVFNNRRYEAMKRNHQRYYPDGVAAGADLWHGVHIYGPDYAEMAKPFGFHGQRVEKPGELKAALQEALEATRNGKTAILNVALNG